MSWRARLTPALSTISVFLNPKDPNCFGVRNWWRKNMPELQLLNPTCNISIQELSFGEPHMFVHYSLTDYRMVRLAGATEEECEDLMQACVTYGINHAILDKQTADDGGDLSDGSTITSFGYAESFIAKLEVKPQNDLGQSCVEGVDDPGQRVRVYPRNAGLKLVP